MGEQKYQGCDEYTGVRLDHVSSNASDLKGLDSARLQKGTRPHWFNKLVQKYICHARQRFLLGEFAFNSI